MTTVMCESLWGAISPDSVLKAWASELNQISSKPFDATEWAMVGHGVIIEHDHPLDIRAYLPMIKQASDCNIVLLDADQVMDSELLLESIRTDLPTIIFVEPGYWISPTVIDDDERGFPLSAQRDDQLASRIRKLLVEVVFKEIADKPILIVVSLKVAQQMEDILRTVGCFDRKIKFPAIDRIKQVEAFVATLGLDMVDDSILQRAEQVGVILQEDYADLRRRELMMVALRRIAWRQKRKVSVRDLIEMTVYGTAEEDLIKLDSKTLRESAIHEAGHAIVAYLDSENRTAPIYCAVGKRGDMTGVVVRQCSSYQKVSNNDTFKEAIHSIRVCLAGRAAEELILGLENTSGCGASEDLKIAAKLANRLFARWGYPVHNEIGYSIGSNISVVIGQPTNSEFQYLEDLVRAFLQSQYQQIITLLEQNRGLLEFITIVMERKGILLQAEFESLASQWLECQPTFKVT